jgi:hypothetical protein
VFHDLQSWLEIDRSIPRIAAIPHSRARRSSPSKEGQIKLKMESAPQRSRRSPSVVLSPRPGCRGWRRTDGPEPPSHVPTLDFLLRIERLTARFHAAPAHLSLQAFSERLDRRHVTSSLCVVDHAEDTPGGDSRIIPHERRKAFVPSSTGSRADLQQINFYLCVQRDTSRLAKIWSMEFHLFGQRKYDKNDVSSKF